MGDIDESLASMTSEGDALLEQQLEEQEKKIQQMRAEDPTLSSLEQGGADAPSGSPKGAARDSPKATSPAALSDAARSASIDDDYSDGFDDEDDDEQDISAGGLSTGGASTGSGGLGGSSSGRDGLSTGEADDDGDELELSTASQSYDDYSMSFQESPRHSTLNASVSVFDQSDPSVEGSSALEEFDFYEKVEVLSEGVEGEDGSK